MPSVTSPNNYLVVLLGASEWPKAPEFRKSKAFVNSAQGFQDYFLNQNKFRLPVDSLLNLFDSNLGNDELDERISEWIKTRVSVSQQATNRPTDLIVIFIGHGGFVNGVDEYFLAIRRTRANNPAASSIPITALAKTIKEGARYLRRYIILDCCFAASAYKHFQSSEIAQVATKQAFEAFAVPGKGDGTPQRGTTLLCSSRHNKPSLLSPGEEFTMFSEALLHTLEHGNPSYQENLSIKAICTLTQDYLTTRYQDEAPRPEVHSPDQSEGDVAGVPLFPNLAKDKSIESETKTDSAETVAGAEAKQVHKQRIDLLIGEKFASLLHALKAMRISLAVLIILIAFVTTYVYFKNRNMRRNVNSGSPDTTSATINNGREFKESALIGHDWWVNSVAFSPDGKTIASGGDDSTVRLWDFQTGKLKQTIKASGNTVDRVVFSPDGKLLGSQGRDNTAKIWDASSGELKELLIGYHYYDGYSNYVSGLSFSPDSTELVSGLGEFSTIGKIRGWDTRNGGVTFEWSVNRDTVALVLFSPIAWTLASVDSENEKYSVKLWDAGQGRLRHTLIKNSTMVDAICFSPDGTTLATSEKDIGIKLWDVQTGQMKRLLGGFGATTMAFSPSGDVLACGSSLGDIEFRNVTTNAVIKVLRLEHGGSVKSVVFSPSGKTLVSGGQEKMIRLWDISDIAPTK